ncbi:MAG TPA: hypothetical protein PKG84_09075 [Novosphingobium sp.]|nr:hypothetical protein [Novosphingobium sp.]
MQYAIGLGTTLVVGFLMGKLVGFGLLPMLVALGLGIMAYGLANQKIKKGGGTDAG